MSITAEERRIRNSTQRRTEFSPQVPSRDQMEDGESKYARAKGENLRQYVRIGSKVYYSEYLPVSEPLPIKAKVTTLSDVNITGDLDVDGVTNLDSVDIDNAVQIDGALTVGVNDVGHDVKFFGAAAGSYMIWDEDQNRLELRGASADAVGSTGTLLLTTAQTDVRDGDILGRIDFQAPLEATETDAILVGASIWAEAEDTFAADNNETDLVFATGASETAVEKMRLAYNGTLSLPTANIYFANSSGNTLIASDGNDQDIIFGTSIGGSSSFGDAKLEYNSANALFQITHPDSSGGNEPTFRFSKKYGAAGGAIGGISAHFGDGTQPAAQMNFQAVGHTGGEFHFYISADTGTLASNTSPSLGLKVNSAAVISGPSDTYHTPSDVSLKENITTISSALEAVKQLRGVEFTWKSEHDPYKKTNEEDEDDSRLGQKNIGFIAQEVEVIAPHLVRSHPDTGIKSISDSNQMSAYIVEAIKELSAEVDKLKE